MIAIIDGDDISLTTEQIIDWLDYYKKDWIRINGADYLNETTTIHITDTDNYILNEKFSSVWYRGFLRDRKISSLLLKDLTCSNDSLIELNKIIIAEFSTMRNYLLSEMLAKNCEFFPNKSSLEFTKLKVLKIAKENGLLVPAYLITNSKKELMDFYHAKKGNVITKPMFENPTFFENNKMIRFLTTQLNEIDKLPDYFFPSFFQELITKRYELRIFFIRKQLYPMVIFSQNDEKTAIDFRNYNTKNPNRTDPYNLPIEVRQNVLKLISKMKLNTGSIDMIKSIDGNYYFLEVNPSGQLGMTSIPCNYYLEQKIAQTLK